MLSVTCPRPSPSPDASTPASLPRPVPLAGNPSDGGDERDMTSLAVIQMWTVHLFGRRGPAE